ncbi:MAG: GNAT family N-acetyltransferase [Myxococcus sp.]|nr:GNAT family N-acetyltransferase [Myxococcus sp.]
MAPDSKAPGFKVRPARRGDAQGVVALLNEAGAQADAQTFAWTISHPEMEVLVAADALDKVVGVVSLSHRPLLKVGGRAATIDELGVARAWARRGVGRELLKRAVERAKVLSVKRLEVQTFAGLTSEVDAFFKACGFERADVGVFRLK